MSVKGGKGMLWEGLQSPGSVVSPPGGSRAHGPKVWGSGHPSREGAGRRRELHVNLDARSQRPLGLGVMGIRGVRPWVRWGRGGEPPGVPAGATTCMGPAAA